MNVLIFGATGMVGQSVLRECLLDPQVLSIISVGRSATQKTHAKFHEHVVSDVTDLSSIKEELASVDACFFCLGVSSVGMNEEKYRAITYDLTLSIANTLVAIQPQMSFIYVTGASTDSTEQGKTMWARVKGKTENDLLKLPFKAAYMFRPGAILPKNGIKSKTKLYQYLYVALKPLFLLMGKMYPNSVINSDQIGRAMINVARDGYSKKLMESVDIRLASRI